MFAAPAADSWNAPKEEPRGAGVERPHVIAVQARRLLLLVIVVALMTVGVARAQGPMEEETPEAPAASPTAAGPVALPPAFEPLPEGLRPSVAPTESGDRRAVKEMHVPSVRSQPLVTVLVLLAVALAVFIPIRRRANSVSKRKPDYSRVGPAERTTKKKIWRI